MFNVERKDESDRYCGEIKTWGDYEKSKDEEERKKKDKENSDEAFKNPGGDDNGNARSTS